MIEEQVVITSLEEGGAWVEGVQLSACGSCSAKAGCGSHAMNQLGRKVSLWLPNDDSQCENLAIGQQIVVGLPEGAILRSTLVLYGIPLFFLLVGAIIGHALAGELLSIVFSVLFMLLGFKLARSRAEHNRRHWQPKFIRTCASSTAIFEPVKIIES